MHGSNSSTPIPTFPLQGGRSGSEGEGYVWFYDLTADGYSLDDKRTPIAANDIPDLLAKWPNREEGPNSYRVPIEKIRENDWSLAAGRYKPVTTETVNHDVPDEILRDVLKLENEIIRRGNALLTSLSPVPSPASGRGRSTAEGEGRKKK